MFLKQLLLLSKHKFSTYYFNSFTFINKHNKYTLLRHKKVDRIALKSFTEINKKKLYFACLCNHCYYFYHTNFFVALYLY